MNSQRSFFGFIVAGVITLLLIAAGFYWFLLPKSPVNLSFPTSEPGAAIFVSKLSPAMVSLLVNPDSLQAIEQKGEISKLKTSLLAKSSINYQDDIKPWLSNEITLAVISQDIDYDPENGLQPGYLMALATEEPEKSREFVELLFSQRALAGANLAVEEYKGIKLLYDSQEVTTSEKIQNSLAGAVVDNFVLFANDPKVVREAINNVQAPNLNLSSSAEYQKAIKELPKNPVAVAFLNLPIVSQWQGFKLAESTYDSQIISLVLNSQGLLAESTFLSRKVEEKLSSASCNENEEGFKTSSELSSESKSGGIESPEKPPVHCVLPLATTSEVLPLSPQLSQPVGALQYIPESAGLAIAGANLSNLGDSDLAKLWRQGTATIYGSEAEAISRWVQPLVDVQKRWGSNLSEDIFSWVVGEYAIATLTKDNTASAWVFVVEKTPQLEAGIARLDRIATNNGLNISSLTLNQQKVSAWTELTATPDQALVNVEAKIQGVHTSINNYEIFTSDLAMMEKVLTTKEKALIDNSNFQNTIATIPQPNQGYVYIDWKKSQKMLERQLPILKFVEVLGKPLFNNLRSLTVSNYSSEPGTLKGGVFFQLDH